MYDRRIHYSDYIKSNAQNLTVKIASNPSKVENLETLSTSITWTLKTQLCSLNEMLFAFEKEVNLSVLECFLTHPKLLLNEIILREDFVYFGDYLQLVNAEVLIYLKSLNTWIRCRSDLIKLSADNSKGHTVYVDDEYIVINRCMEMSFQNLKVEETKGDASCDIKPEIISLVENNTELLVLPKSRVMVNYMTTINLETLPKYDFVPHNTLVVRKDHIENMNEILSKAPSSIDIDADFDDYYASISNDTINLLFASNLKYLSLIDEQMTEECYDNFISKLELNQSLVYIEFHEIQTDRLRQLLDTLRYNSNILRLVFYLSPSADVKALLKQYKRYRPFTSIQVINLSQLN